MATNFHTFKSAGIHACAISAHRNSDDTSRRSTSQNWWSPIFSWSSDPDYIDSNNDNSNGNRFRSIGGLINEVSPSSSSINPRNGAGDMKLAARSRFTPGCFTEEKAKQLRMMTTEMESYHDAMYHSAIASRLASDFSADGGDLQWLCRCSQPIAAGSLAGTPHRLMVVDWLGMMAWLAVWNGTPKNQWYDGQCLGECTQLTWFPQELG
ncbi:hypothetical protein Dimus_023536 [Dionaea muscipula]